MDIKDPFPSEKCRVQNGDTIVFSNSLFGGVRVKKGEKGYVVCSSSEIKSVALILMVLSFLIMFFIVNLDSPLFYSALILGTIVKLLSILITEARVLYVKERIFSYNGSLNVD